MVNTISHILLSDGSKAFLNESFCILLLFVDYRVSFNRSKEVLNATKD